MEGAKNKYLARQRRRKRVRKRIFGTKERPRLSVCKSNKYLYVQLIDDNEGVTLATVSSLKYAKRGSCAKNLEVAKRLGEDLGRLASDKGIKRMVFDRNGYPYHGRIKAIAEAIRARGIKL